MVGVIFNKSFTQQESIPLEGINLVTSILKSGRLHRYNLELNEESHASLLEKEFSKWQGSDYCIACTSGGYAIQLALRVCGIRANDKVLANAYTLAPVPGAIHSVGAKPVFVEIDDNYHIDIEDLANKIESTGSRYLLLSHMRGHIADMEKIVELCNRRKVVLIEDCAHTMGARWKGTRSGNFGKIAAFSTQTYKHINSGEGGFITTNDPELAARAVVSSGSYMLYGRHGAIPAKEFFEKTRLFSPNYSGRIDQVRAALLRAQLPNLNEKVHRWNRLYNSIFSRLSKIKEISIPARKKEEFYVGSSIQFKLPTLDSSKIPIFVKKCFDRGIELKWFGDDEPKGYTSRYDSWLYIDGLPKLTKTLSVLEKTLDMRIPLTFDKHDCSIIGDIIEEELIKANTK